MVNEARKKSIFKKWWFWVIAGVSGFLFSIVAVFALLIIFVGGDSPESKTPPIEVKSEAVSSPKEGAEVAKEEEEEEEEEPSGSGIGDIVKMKDFEIMVLSSSVEANVGGEYGKNAQGTFLLVELTINNVGDKAGSIDSTQFKLLHDGVEYNSDGGAGVYANDDHGLILTSINPGNSITTVMPFDIPEDVANSDGLVVQISEGMFSGKSVTIELK